MTPACKLNIKEQSNLDQQNTDLNQWSAKWDIFNPFFVLILDIFYFKNTVGPDNLASEEAN